MVYKADHWGVTSVRFSVTPTCCNHTMTPIFFHQFQTSCRFPRCSPFTKM